MSTIIKTQYETAKQLLKAAEQNLRLYDLLNDDKRWEDFYNMATSLLTIVGGVDAYSFSIVQKTRPAGVSIIDDCRQRFAAYESELIKAGLIPSVWEQILADVEQTEPVQQIEYTDEQKAQMWYEHQKQIQDYDPQF